MAQHSEATTRVFERALELLETKLDADRVAALRGLVAAGELGDLARLEEILGPISKAATSDAD
jgi:hypothetical protein